MSLRHKRAPGEPQLSVFVSTVKDGRLVNRAGLSRKHILDAARASVERLGTYVEFQIQRMDPDVPRDEVMRALSDVAEVGLARYIGASSMPACEIQALQNVARDHGRHQFISMQNYYNLPYREEEREMMPYCRGAGVSCILIIHEMTVRLISSCNRTDAAISRLYNRENQTDEAIGNAVEEMAAAREVSMAVVATAWSLRKGVDPIVGLNSKEYIAEAVAAAKLVLTEDAVKLEKAYQAR